MRIISDSAIQRILSSLSSEGIQRYQRVLYKALEKYHADPTLIPERVVVSRPELECIHLFMPTFADRVGVKTLGGSKEGFKGAVMIMNEQNGELEGVLNAMTLTAFRTALASSIPLMKYFKKEKPNQVITAYGNGLQSYWHIKLTLNLFPKSFSRVQIVVRSINDKSNELQKQLSTEFTNIKFDLVESSTNVDLSTSDIIYGCIPSTEPGIHYESLNKDEQTYISIIGSYKPFMFEVDDAIVQKALSNGKVIVDSYEHTLAEAGELIKNNVKPGNCVEIGELDNLTTKQINNDDKLVLVKIVGLAIMDISVGTEILEQCQRENIGVDVAEF